MTFSKTKRWKNYIALFEVKKIEKSKVSYFLEEILVLFIICSECKNEDEKISKEKESTEI